MSFSMLYKCSKTYTKTLLITKYILPHIYLIDEFYQTLSNE